VRRVAPLLIGMVLSLSACADRPYQRIVVIDPGHGGRDPGAIGSTGQVLEKEVALRAGLALRDLLEATGRYRVIMTRDDDRFVRLPDRLEIARRSQGELFVSLHADSLVGAPEVGGASVYTLAQGGSRDDAARLVSTASAANILVGMARSRQEDIAPDMLVDLPERDTAGESVRLAELLVEELNGATTMVKLRPAQAGFVVLTSRAMPSVLIELGYVSNPADEQALADDAHIARLATAIARAVEVYFGAGLS
jgi:N-acetylmuramoyl-L-alanine amidase